MTGYVAVKNGGCVAKVVCSADSCPGEHTACAIADNTITCGCEQGLVSRVIFLFN